MALVIGSRCDADMAIVTALNNTLGIARRSRLHDAFSLPLVSTRTLASYLYHPRTASWRAAPLQYVVKQRNEPAAFADSDLLLTDYWLMDVVDRPAR